MYINLTGVRFMALKLLYQQPTQTGNLRPPQNRPPFPTSGTGPKVLRTRPLSAPEFKTHRLCTTHKANDPQAPQRHDPKLVQLSLNQKYYR